MIRGVRDDDGEKDDKGDKGDDDDDKSAKVGTFIGDSV